MPQLVRIEVDGMLGRFDHVVPFPEDWEFVIIHGPNGVGKTKFLELLSATFNFQIGRIASIPFQKARFDFDDGASLRVTKVVASPEEIRPRRARNVSLHSGINLHFEILGVKGPKISWTSQSDISPSSARLRQFLMQVAPVQRIGGDRYQDMSNGDLLSFIEVLDKYGHMLPQELSPVAERPAELKDFLAQTKVYLIETQRLLNLPTRVSNIQTRPAPDAELPQSRVSYYSDDLSRRLREALAQNSRRSQELDRTFPLRLLQGNTSVKVTDDQIRRKYAQQDQLRARLAEIDVAQASSGYFPLPERSLEPWERRVLWTYLEDTERKLETFKDVLDRVRLLKEIVNSRFKYKTLRISREQGFLVETNDTGQEIPPDRLSSGEQHELVLAYDLLFQVQEKTVVLIDEPEISLHVGWQRQFLYDLVEIAKVTSLRFVIATHSPQIIHKWRERTVPLVPKSEMDD
ncbi:AAA family ATPase [Micromonospora sp. WMMD1120]|uniref:AAA family ATPase n=1 Tax=Micromonospora sp. WMMD1120 TaxID=3016106 RepID=UPI002416FE9B|nr:AAA family ATPase [Micromonospora sp. WMMD1120]MDG4807169.1 AAA family ATPase [Micromonospora sp. WMMD1120]